MWNRFITHQRQKFVLCFCFSDSARLISDALNTKNREVMCVTLKILQHLVESSDLVGPALVPFYRQLLPMFNMFRVKNGKAIHSLTIVHITICIRASPLSPIDFHFEQLIVAIASIMASIRITTLEI